MYHVGTCAEAGTAVLKDVPVQSTGRIVAPVLRVSVLNPSLGLGAPPSRVKHPDMLPEVARPCAHPSPPAWHWHQPAFAET